MEKNRPLPVPLARLLFGRTAPTDGRGRAPNGGSKVPN